MKARKPWSLTSDARQVYDLPGSIDFFEGYDLRIFGHRPKTVNYYAFGKSETYRASEVKDLTWLEATPHATQVFHTFGSVRASPAQW